VNILAVTHIFPSRAQPQEGVFNALQMGEVAKRAQVTLLTPVRWTLSLPGRGKNSTPDAPVAAFDHISPLFLYPPGILRGYHGHFYLASIRRAAERARRKIRFDVIYGMFAYPDGWACARLAEDWGLPFVLKVHGSDVHQIRSDACRSSRLSETLRRARRVIAVSQALGREVKEIVPEAQVAVVRNGIDLRKFSPGARREARARLGLDSERPLVLFVGRLERVKGADLLPEIADHVRTKATWAVIGEGSLSGVIRGGMSRHEVRWIPEVSHSELVHWYRATNVLVVPSRNEGLPNAPLEALACDRPVVISRVGGVPEFMTDPDAGTLVESGDVEAFSLAIDRWVTGEPGKGTCRNLVSGMGWERSGEELLKVLEEATAC
jgi:glycosyltransferase involved in cell wall biosynthesis